MPLSKRLHEAASSPVFDYQPKKIEPSGGRLHSEAEGSLFTVHPIIEESLKIASKKKQEEERILSERVLEKIEQIQKEAYEAGFELGKAEGRQDAFVKTKREIEQHLQSLDQLITNLKNIRIDWIEQQEQSVMRLIFSIAKKIAAHEVSINPKATLEMTRQLIGRLQGEESIRLDISPELLDFFIEAQTRGEKDNQKEFEFLKEVKISPLAALKNGGCILSTNLVELDSQFETRVSELWSQISSAFSPPQAEFRSDAYLQLDEPRPRDQHSSVDHEVESSSHEESN
jgi:flagellar assembly protein FliH